ncbi:hypothetical protein BCR39DRAFT_585406 [Naematelia encephala]|uniref:DUF6534 domain-containing protein n=1 Tax=Naematelia encephala TaxID=71784 RepID=A0A1Y2BM37_9TREE|nr:hypothetical protein BCR39DRAFT_585406 [Naematelia encephala]
MAESSLVDGTSHNPYPVRPTGYLVGSYFACGLYALHCSQIHHYFGTFTLDTWRTKLLVIWIWTLSTLQIIIIVGTAHRYFVGGIDDPRVWGDFWWPLSFQDGLIPIMAFTAQLYFGRRAWLLLGRKRWFGWLAIIVPTITALCGLALAITARLWADAPWVSLSSWQTTTRTIGIPSEIVAILWMGLSAFTDGTLTLILVYHFIRARRSATILTETIASRLVALTLETVLLTHIVGATMVIIFLASPASHRSNNNLFWVLLEVVTELYALSVLFTINSRQASEPDSPLLNIDIDVKGSVKEMDASPSTIERIVEGRQESAMATPETMYNSSAGYTNSSGSGSGSRGVSSAGAFEMRRMRLAGSNGGGSGERLVGGSGSAGSGTPITPLSEVLFVSASSPEEGYGFPAVQRRSREKDR